MLRFVDTAAQELAPYAEYTPDDRLDRIRELASQLQAVRILQLNATSYGGGVAELLNSLVPLERGLGLDVAWGVIVAEPPFFEMTKRLHNALQGAREFGTGDGEREAYLLHNQHVADAIADQFDVVIVSHQDPIQAGRLRLIGSPLAGLHQEKPGHGAVVTLRPGEVWREETVWEPGESTRVADHQGLRVLHRHEESADPTSA